MNARAHICTCPACGSVLDSRSDLEQLMDGAQPLLRRILQVISRQPGLNGAQLASVVYAHDPDGGPLYAEKSISSVISRNRGLLALYGYEIRRYRLIRIADQPSAGCGHV